MNKAEREVRALLKNHPHVKLESDGGGFVLVGPNRQRRRIGALRGNHNMRHVEHWIQQMSAPQGGQRLEDRE